MELFFKATDVISTLITLELFCNIDIFVKQFLLHYLNGELHRKRFSFFPLFYSSLLLFLARNFASCWENPG